MDLIHSIQMALTTPYLLVTLVLCAFFGTVSFAAAIKPSVNKTYLSYIAKYGYTFIAVNFIARCFIVLLCPEKLTEWNTFATIAAGTAMLLGFGAAFNVFSHHVSHQVTKLQKQKKK